MLRHIFNGNAFMVYMDYSADTNELFIVMRNGKQYVCRSFMPEDFNKLNKAVSKVSYISNHILHNNPDKPELVNTIPQEELNKISQPYGHYNRSYNHLLKR